MSLIDTAVIGQTSSIQLTALGPGTVFCDYMSYGFMFLCITTSNMVATSVAQKDDVGLRRQISVLLFIVVTCGVGMLLFTKFLGLQADVQERQRQMTEVLRAPFSNQQTRFRHYHLTKVS